VERFFRIRAFTKTDDLFSQNPSPPDFQNFSRNFLNFSKNNAQFFKK